MSKKLTRRDFARGARMASRKTDPGQTVTKIRDQGPENGPAYRLYEIVTNGPQTVTPDAGSSVVPLLRLGSPGHQRTDVSLVRRTAKLTAVSGRSIPASQGGIRSTGCCPFVAISDKRYTGPFYGAGPRIFSTVCSGSIFQAHERVGPREPTSRAMGWRNYYRDESRLYGAHPQIRDRVIVRAPRCLQCRKRLQSGLTSPRRPQHGPRARRSPRSLRSHRRDRQRRDGSGASGNGS